MKYKYEALDAQGIIEEATVKAKSRKDAVQIIRDMELFPIKIQEDTTQKTGQQIKKELLEKLNEIIGNKTDAEEESGLEDELAAKYRELLESIEELRQEEEKLQDDEQIIKEVFDSIEEYVREIVGKVANWLSSNKPRANKIEEQLQEIIAQLKEMNKHFSRMPKELSGETGPG